MEIESKYDITKSIRNPFKLGKENKLKNKRDTKYGIIKN